MNKIEWIKKDKNSIDKNNRFKIIKGKGRFYLYDREVKISYGSFLKLENKAKELLINDRDKRICDICKNGCCLEKDLLPEGWIGLLFNNKYTCFCDNCLGKEEVINKKEDRKDEIRIRTN